MQIFAVGIFIVPCYNAINNKREFRKFKVGKLRCLGYFIDNHNLTIKHSGCLCFLLQFFIKLKKKRFYKVNFGIEMCTSNTYQIFKISSQNSQKGIFVSLNFPKNEPNFRRISVSKILKNQQMLIIANANQQQLICVFISLILPRDQGKNP